MQETRTQVRETLKAETVNINRKDSTKDLIQPMVYRTCGTYTV